MLSNRISYVLLLFFSFIVQVRSQLCRGTAEDYRCSSNIACGCLKMAGAMDIGICGFRYMSCSELTPCERWTNNCYEPHHICVQYPRYSANPVCLSASMVDDQICPPITIPTYPIKGNQKWKQDGITIAGGNGQGEQLNQLSAPQGIYVDDDRQSIYIAESENHRIVEWKFGASNGKVVAGGNGRGSQTNQLNTPLDVIVDKKNDSLIICDRWNRRIVEWSRQDNTRAGKEIISDVHCRGVAMDHNGEIYVSDLSKHEVRRWKRGEKQGILVAGGNGPGNGLHQLFSPTYLFVDEDQSVYISDWNNQRVMKWLKGAKQGIIVAGGQGKGNGSSQIVAPEGIIVDRWGSVYVSDRDNHRITRWLEGSKEGRVIVGGNGNGNQSNQLNQPEGLSFDRFGHLYVVDYSNFRIQLFNIDNS